MAKTYVDTLANRSAAVDGSTSSDGLFTWAHKDAGNTAATTSGTGVSLSAGATGSYGTSADCDTDVIYAEVEVTAVTAPASCAFWFDVQQDGTYPTGTGYEAGLFSGTANIQRINSGAFNTLDSQSHTIQVGVYRLEYTRSTGALALKFNGSTIASATNTSEPGGSGKRKSLLGFDIGGIGTITFKNFGYGDLGGAAVADQLESPMQHGGLRQVMVQ